MVHGVFDPQYQGYGEKFLVISYLKVGFYVKISRISWYKSFVPGYGA
jgi:hypothetical protein